MGTLNYQTIEKRDIIKKAGYNHISTYECQLTKNKDFQRFAQLSKTLEIVEPLNPRHSFYGGRVKASQLLYNFKDNQYGRYVDFFSLYPTVQYYKNIQLVILPKYSIPKSVTNLGTVSLSAKSFLQEGFIIPSYHKGSK